MIYISLFIISFYIIYSIIKKKTIPHSLSSTYYDNGIWFSLCLLSSVWLLFDSMLKISPENWEFLVFLTISGLSFVGFSPNYQTDTLVDQVHTGAAISGVVASQLWVLIINPWFLILWAICIFIDKSKLLFVSEIIALLTVYGTLLWQ